MGVYHLLLIHFPIALLNVAFAFVVVRVFSTSRLAMRLGDAVVPLVFLGVLSGLAAYALGFTVWPLSALTASPLGRNHLLMATWTIAYWTVMWLLAWRVGDRMWSGGRRWVTLVLGAIGIAPLTVTSTLGGSLAGNPSGVTATVRALGFEVYTTFYVPSTTLWIMFAAALAILALGFWGRVRTA